MSFSQDIKEEILNNLSNKKIKKCCLDAERFGEYLTQVSSKAEIETEFKDYFEISKLDECCIKAILKGVYLSSGCVVDPQSDYHFEIIVKNKTCAVFLMRLLEVLDFTPKSIKRKGASTITYVIYIKDSEQISKFLSIIEASNAMLKFEQIRVEKDVKNNINRSINCETANLFKTISNSTKQINAIEKLKSSGKFLMLDEKLKYIANLRLSNKEASLDALANLTQGENKLSKSGIKHRLDKLVELAEEKQGE